MRNDLGGGGRTPSVTHALCTPHYIDVWNNGDQRIVLLKPYVEGFRFLVAEKVLDFGELSA